MSYDELKELEGLLGDLEKEEACAHHLDFIMYCWPKKEDDPFIVGFHTQKICGRIDLAFADFRAGKSTYLLINVHHRSGKSDIVSRFLAPHFLGEFPDKEAMQVACTAPLAKKFGGYARNIFKGRRFAKLYPDVSLSKDSSAKHFWKIKSADHEGVDGKLFSCGLTSGLIGSGFHLGILDDYCASRADAESAVMRDKTWEAFTNDFMTRSAPVHMVIILATQWHWDDISGRIRQHMKDNPNFPRFEELVFPARAADYRGPGKYAGKYLFSERYSRQWYENQYATLGKYAAAALLDCNPYQRQGGVLSTDGIIIHDDIDLDFPSETDVRWMRVWDLAHTAKQRQKDNPDYTSGTKLTFVMRENDSIPHLYVKDVKRCRKGARSRDNFIRMISSLDVRFVKQGIEDSLDSKDAYHYIRSAIPGVSWTKIIVKGDKLVRATPLEIIFEAPGHVHIARGSWNDPWIEEVIRFDGLGTTHDDQIDNMSAGYEYFFHGLHLEERHIEQMRQRRARK